MLGHVFAIELGFAVRARLNGVKLLVVLLLEMDVIELGTLSALSEVPHTVGVVTRYLFDWEEILAVFALFHVCIL